MGVSTHHYFAEVTMDWHRVAAGLPDEPGTFCLYFKHTGAFAVGDFDPTSGWFYPHDAEADLVFSRQPTHYASVEAPAE